MFKQLYAHVPYPKLDEVMNELIERRVAPEIYFQAPQLEDGALSPAQLRRQAEKLRTAGLPCSFHGPFLDLSPGAWDPAIRRVTAERFASTFVLAEIFAPRVIVLHSGYERWRFNLNVNLWLEKSIEFWRPFARRAEDQGLVLAVENIFENTPGGLRLLFDEINSPAFGGCFDIGHWHIFGEMDLSEWLALIGRHLISCHLHDNRGRFDDHLPPGDGLIDFAAFKFLMRQWSLEARVHTFELHDFSQLGRALDWFRNNGFLED